MSPSTNHAYAVLALRLGLGVVFIAHGLLKALVFTLPGTAAWFDGVGLPGVLAYPVFLTELLGGMLLIVGLYTRWAALALMPVALGAAAVHWPNGWIFTSPNGGWEFPAFLAIACVALFLLGEHGALALSTRIGPQSRQPSRA